MCNYIVRSKVIRIRHNIYVWRYQPKKGVFTFYFSGIPSFFSIHYVGCRFCFPLFPLHLVIHDIFPLLHNVPCPKVMRKLKFLNYCLSLCREEFVFKDIVDTEISTKSMFEWMSVLPMHKFAPRHFEQVICSFLLRNYYYWKSMLEISIQTNSGYELILT